MEFFWAVTYIHLFIQTTSAFSTPGFVRFYLKLNLSQLADLKPNQREQDVQHRVPLENPLSIWVLV